MLSVPFRFGLVSADTPSGAEIKPLQRTGFPLSSNASRGAARRDPAPAGTDLGLGCSPPRWFWCHSAPSPKRRVLICGALHFWGLLSSHEHTGGKKNKCFKIESKQTLTLIRKVMRPGTPSTPGSDQLSSRAKRWKCQQKRGGLASGRS